MLWQCQLKMASLTEVFKLLSFLSLFSAVTSTNDFITKEELNEILKDFLTKDGLKEVVKDLKEEILTVVQSKYEGKYTSSKAKTEKCSFGQTISVWFAELYNCYLTLFIRFKFYSGKA